jgi:hypothetical protein
VAGNGGGKSGGSDVIVQSQQGEIHPRGFLSAIGYIEQSYANERGGCLINPEFLTTPQRLEFMEVGFRSSLASGFAMALLAPLAIGVLNRYIPIFGSYEPTLYDKFCGIMLAMVFSLGYSFFLASAAVKHLGGYSRAMVSNLVGGVAIASILKAIVVFIAYHFLYFKVLSPTNVAWVLQKLQSAKLSYGNAVTAFNWIIEFKKVFITSSYFILLSTVVFVAIPYAAMLWAHFRNKKLIDAGVVDVFRQDA